MQDVCYLSTVKENTEKELWSSTQKKGEITKWSRVNVDLWGPKTVKNKNGWKYKIHIITMVDPVIGWFEQAQMYGKPIASRCMRILDTTWLACYPQPREIGFDNGEN